MCVFLNKTELRRSESNNPMILSATLLPSLLVSYGRRYSRNTDISGTNGGDVNATLRRTSKCLRAGRVFLKEGTKTRLSN